MAACDRIKIDGEKNDRYGRSSCRRCLQRKLIAADNKHVGFIRDQFVGVRESLNSALVGPPMLDEEIASLGESEFVQLSREDLQTFPGDGIGAVAGQYADAGDLAALLRMRGERPRTRS